MRVRHALLLGMLATLVVAALPAGASARRAPRGFYGVTWDHNLNLRPQAVQDRQWDLMAASGVESARVSFSWASLQPTRGPIDFAVTDRLVERAARRRIQLLPVIFEAPSWAELDQTRRNSPPRRMRDFAGFVQALVGRYGRRGSFWAARPDVPRRPVRFWQIWNEPDLRFYWNVPRDWSAAWPRGYVRLLKAARSAIRSRDRAGKLVLGGLSARPWVQLKRLYRLHARPLFDVVAVHPYNSGLRSALEVVRIVRGVMRRRGDARKALWVTELGWPAARGRVKLTRGLRRLVTTDHGMARRIRTGYNAFLSRRRNSRYGVSRVYWFTWASSYQGGEGGIWNYAGLLRTQPLDFVRTPALGAYRASARRNQGCRKTITGRCR